MPSNPDLGVGADLPNDPAPTERRERQTGSTAGSRLLGSPLLEGRTGVVGDAQPVLCRGGRSTRAGTDRGRAQCGVAGRARVAHHHTTAVDFSGVGIEKARSLAARRGCSVTWVVEDLLTFRPAPAAFDLVALVYIHLPALQRRQVLTTAVRALAPAGRLVVVGHDRSNLLAGVGGPQDPSILFTPEEIVSDLDGLDIVRSQKVVRHVKAPDGERDRIDALVVAVRPGAA
jgi:SAM-dependent methyltransferase